MKKPWNKIKSEIARAFAPGIGAIYCAIIDSNGQTGEITILDSDNLELIDNIRYVKYYIPMAEL